MTTLNGTLSEIEIAFAGLPEAMQAKPEIATLRREAEAILLGNDVGTLTNFESSASTIPKPEGNGVAGALAKIQVAIGRVPRGVIENNPELWRKIVGWRNRIEDTFAGFVPDIVLTQ